MFKDESVAPGKRTGRLNGWTNLSSASAVSIISSTPDSDVGIVLLRVVGVGDVTLSVDYWAGRGAPITMQYAARPAP